MDRVLNASLWLTIMGLIAATAAGALLMTWSGAMALCSMSGTQGTIQLAVGIALGTFSYKLCQHANDLMDR